MSVDIEVVDSPARACSAMMVGAAAGGGHVVLAGGSTPREANEQFVEAVQTVGVSLTETTFWFGDERCVSPDDERSNYLMVKRSLLGPLGRDNQPRVFRMKGELGPQAGAEHYDQVLHAEGPGEFDLLLLGIGPDGHTLSLFPCQPAVRERSRWVYGVEDAGLEPFVPRITLTLPALAAARRAVVLASGESKADAVAAAFGPNARPDTQVPSSLLAGAVKELIVLCDPAAAAKL